MSSNKDMVNVKDMSIEKDFKVSSNVKDTSSEDTSSEDTSNATMQVPTPSMLDEKSKEQDFLTQIIRMAVREAVLKMLREEYVKHSNVDDFIKQFFQRRMALKGPGIIGSKMNALKMSKTIAKRAEDDEQVKQKFAELERRVGILELNMKNLFNSRENLLKLTSNVRTQMDMVKSLSEELAKGCESISDVRPPGELFQSSTDVTIVCSQPSDVYAIDKLESDKPDNSDNFDKHNHKSKDHSEHKKNKVRGKGLHKSEATINLSGSSITFYRPKSKSPRKDCASAETLELLHHACSSDIKERVSFIPGKHLDVAKKGVQEKLQLDNSQIPQVSTEISDELMAIYRNDIKEFSQILQTMFSNSFHSFASDKFNEHEEDTRRVGSNYYQPNFVNSSNFGNVSMTPDNSDISDNSDSNENSTTDLFKNFNVNTQGYQTSSQKIANLSSILQRSAEKLATIQSMADMLEKHRADVEKNAKDAAQGAQETKKNCKELSNITERSVSTSFLSLQNELGASFSSTSLVRSRCWDKKELEKRLDSKQQTEVLDEKCKLLESNFGQLDLDSDKNKEANKEKLENSLPEEYKAYTENMVKMYEETRDVATQTDGVTKISTVESGQQTVRKEITKDFQQQTEPAACIARATGQQARGLLDGIFMLASEKNMREMIGDNTNKEVFLLNKQRKPSPASELSNKNMKNLKATCKILIGKPHNE